jgi:two-component system nitrogen regulation response regulator NtrX
MSGERILVVDDERNIRRTLSLILQGEGFLPQAVGSAREAVAALEEEPADAVLLDVKLPDRDGISLLRELQERWPGMPVVMISGHANVPMAVEATRAGAFDFLEKPLSRERVLIAVRNALRLGHLGRRVERYEATEALRYQLVGTSPVMEEIRRQIAKVGPTGATVLITGESGTGKELVARALHEASPRREGPFVKVNCAAIPDELIETELFGCVRGAYTGAVESRKGKFLAADRGTIFLDEVGDMSPRVQAKVLRAIQEGEVERVGDTRTLKVDVRVIAATNKDLVAEAAAGRFREDLYFRLNVVPLHVPPLRERREDIPALCEHFLQLYAQENDLPSKRLEPAAVDLLKGLPWKGNVRELRNAIERLAILTDGEVITEADVRSLVFTGSAAVPGAGGDRVFVPEPEEIRAIGGLVEARRRFERACIEACLRRTGGNVSQAARWLGIERTNLHKKMQALGIDTRNLLRDESEGSGTRG